MAVEIYKYNICISGCTAAVGYCSGTRSVADAAELSPVSEMAEGSRESFGENYKTPSGLSPVAHNRAY